MKIRIILICCLMGSSFPAMAQYPYQNPSLSAQQRAEDLCSRLTLEEKASLMCNDSPAIPRLGIPAFNWWSEALHGVGRNGFATVFPNPTSMAASWDDQLLQEVFTAVSDEARAKNNIARKRGRAMINQGLSFWTPNINIFRDPRWGRGQETYGEDPYLTGRMGDAVVRGLQGPEGSKYYKLLACAKHFAVHSGPEWNRHSFNVENLPPRDLWETYLPAFKSLVQDANVREVMCAYQRFDGSPCCGSNRLLQQILRDEWGYTGLVVSDCGAISDFWQKGHHEIVGTREEASAKGVVTGTDVECGGDYHSLPDAVSKGLITEAQINKSVIRLLKARFEVGDFDADDLVPWRKIGPEVVASDRHRQLALKMAQEGVTLLQNKGQLLPLNPQSRIVVMGPNADDAIMQWANYNGFPIKTVTLLEGISAYCPDVRFVQGCGLTRNEVTESRFSRLVNPDGGKGMKAVYWNNENLQGTPVAEGLVLGPLKFSNGEGHGFAPGVGTEGFSARYSATFTPDQTEELRLSLSFNDRARVIINGDTIINQWKDRAYTELHFRERSYRFEANKTYRLVVEYAQYIEMAVLDFDIYATVRTNPERVLRQVGDADVVVFAGGISPRLEAEERDVQEPGFKGGDRTSIEMPQVQRELIAALHQAGKKVVLLNASGGAVALAPEARNADAIVQIWYPGEAGGKAVADVLFGRHNPSGKLPLTFYANDADLPDFLDYTMHNRTYRYFKGQALFPFGYGLSYTTFRFGKPRYRNGKVTVSVKNTGAVDGEEVVQIYLRRNADTAGPIKTLRGFKRVAVKAGETKTVTVDFPRSRFETWDAGTNTMRVVPGAYTLMVGNSSRDQDLTRFAVTIR